MRKRTRTAESSHAAYGGASSVASAERASLQRWVVTMDTVDRGMAGLSARAVAEKDEAAADAGDCTLTFGLNERRYRRLRKFVAHYNDETREKLFSETVLELALWTI